MTAEQKQKLEAAVWVSPQRMSGAPCFRGTRVPVQSLIDLLQGGETIDQFLALYPDVTREQVDAANSQILECASSLREQRPADLGSVTLSNGSSSQSALTSEIIGS